MTVIDFSARLAALGLSLPERCTPRGQFLAYSRSGDVLYLAGQICERNGEVPYRGKVGVDLGLDEGRRAAEMCALNLLFHLSHALDGELGRVRRCLRVGAFVNAPNGFGDSPAVANGASDLFIAMWGEAGRHARTAVGVAALPMDAAVEIDAIFEVS